MTEGEWIDGLRHLSDEKIIQLHFGLQDKIKKHYKLRAEGSNLKKAVELCKQQIALAPLTSEAMKRQHEAKWEELNAIKRKSGMATHIWPLELPAHHGYRQYAIILRRQKDASKLIEIEAKRKAEGWAS